MFGGLLLCPTSRHVINASLYVQLEMFQVYYGKEQYVRSQTKAKVISGHYESNWKF